MTSEVVRHDGLRSRRRARRRRPGHRRARARRPARRRRPQDRAVPRAPSTGLLDARAAVPRGLPGPPGAVRTGSGSRCLQGHRLPGHPVAGRRSTAAPSGSASTTPSSAGCRRTGRCPTASTSRPTRRPATSTWSRAALPRHPVPRRVDPHRARLRAAPRPAAGAAWGEPPGGAVAERSDTAVLVVDHYDSYTWNLVHLVASRHRRPPRRGRARRSLACSTRSLRLLPRRALARARAPRRACRLRRSGADVFAASVPVLGVCLGHAGPGHGVRRDGASGSQPAHGEVAVGAPRRRAASSPASRRRSRRCATTRSPPPRCPTCLEVTARDERTGW